VREDGDPGNVGKILRRYRWVAGLTQEELARQSGLSVRAVSDIERGHTSRPYARTIRLLADALELDEPARTRLMSAVHDGADEDVGEPTGTIGRWPGDAASATVPSAAASAAAAIPAAAIPAAPSRSRRDSRSWRRPRRGGWTHVGVAVAAAALASGVAGWAMVSDHPQASPAVSGLRSSRQLPPVSDGAPPDVAQCDESDQGTVDLSSSVVQGSNGEFWGTVEVRYSYRCDSVWTRFDPSPAVPDTKAVMVTLKIIGLPDGQDQVSSASGSDQTENTNMLPLSNGCAQGLVILLKLGRELASATTTCQAPPSS
jgi:transcriptional regulator with XRE-family HTH domain